MLDISGKAQVVKRNGDVVDFDSALIYRAVEMAFLAENEQGKDEKLPADLQQELDKVVGEVVQMAVPDPTLDISVSVEKLQDLVEMQLMRFGHYKVAKCYILYREDRTKARSLKGKATEQEKRTIEVVAADGSKSSLEWSDLQSRLERAFKGLDNCTTEGLEDEISRSLFNGIAEEEVDRALVLATRSKIEKEPQYSNASANLLLDIVYGHVFDLDKPGPVDEQTYRDGFAKYVEIGIEHERTTPALREYDLERIAAALKPERDKDFLYIGLQTVFDRYLLHVEGKRIETPQYFWMRVAMGLAAAEDDKNARAIEFYNVLSTFRFVSSTPTLFNSATLHPQLSSCYLSTINDDLGHIYKVIGDNAQLSKWAGGIGNDWTNIRSTGAQIKGTNGESQGVIPFLKVANDTAIAVNQGGKRKGAVCAYLETWHLEIEEFLELRKNTGDERRRTHDMNTANWVPDLFMKRVVDNGTWTLFSPSEAPDLHDLYGKEFEKRYAEYEEMAVAGKLRQSKQVPAVELWRKMLSMLFETGHPWITFKDPSNIRSPQSHAGVVHSSNLCTEILLNTSEKETAVCNLGSINLPIHVRDGKLDEELLSSTIKTAVRMLDNVIDINYYPTEEAKTSNQKHRPVGMGVMGFQDALYKLKISYASDEAVDFADSSMEMISYYAILTSSELAKERGVYGSYEGSKWSKGIIPLDSLDLLAEERGGHLEVDRTTRMDWQKVRDSISANGMRNSNVMAIAPTATIANITGITQSIEPTYRNLFVKSNLSGEFVSVNPYLVEELKKLDLWDDEMIDDLKYFDGIITQIERIPDELKELYLTAFEIDSSWLIECASRRQKWIDMGQSLNLYLAVPNGKKLNEMYLNAWKSGLKTTYYLRSLGATQIEKSSIDINKRGVQPKWMKNKSASSSVEVTRQTSAPQELTGGCEACE